MEPEMNSENWSQPNENQDQPEQSYQPQSQPQQNSFFQQTWLNIKVSTWLKCLVVATVLSFAAVFIAPKFSKATAKPEQQESSDCYSEEDYWYDNYGYDD